MSTVGSIFNEMLPRLSKSDLSVSFISAMQTTVDVLVRRLWLKKSDLLIAPMAQKTVLQGVTSFALPTDCLGLTDTLYLTVSGQAGQALSPLPSNKRYSFTQQGPPRYYEILGTTCWLYPTPDSSYLIDGRYFQSPTPLVDFSSTIPFNGLFDPIIKDAALQIGAHGVFAVSSPQFEGMLRNYVDQVIQTRNPKSISFFQVATGYQPGFRRW